MARGRPKRTQEDTEDALKTPSSGISAGDAGSTDDGSANQNAIANPPKRRRKKASSAANARNLSTPVTAVMQMNGPPPHPNMYSQPPMGMMSPYDEQQNFMPGMPRGMRPPYMHDGNMPPGAARMIPPPGAHMGPQGGPQYAPPHPSMNGQHAMPPPPQFNPNYGGPDGPFPPPGSGPGGGRMSQPPPPDPSQMPPMSGPGPGPMPPYNGMPPGPPGSQQLWMCGHCRHVIHENDQAILCEGGCHLWNHRTCTGLTELAYTLLTEEVFAEWVCDRCLQEKQGDIPMVKIKW